MKRTLLIAFFCFTALGALADEGWAQSVPGQMSFAARLSDDQGPVDGDVVMVFKVFDSATGGDAIWEETHASVRASEGFVHALLGTEGNELDPSIFDGRTLYLQVNVNTDTLLPRIPLTSVPYAIRAAEAARAETAATAETLGSLAPEDVALKDHTHPEPRLSCTNVESNARSVFPGSPPLTHAVDCPSTHVMTGGGCQTDGPQLAVLQSVPGSNSWRCRVANQGTITLKITANARCCRLQ